MHPNFAYLDDYVKDHVTALLMEVERDHLGDLARGPSRPLRRRMAEWLHATAQRLEGAPTGSVYQPRTA